MGNRKKYYLLLDLTSNNKCFEVISCIPNSKEFSRKEARKIIEEKQLTRKKPFLVILKFIINQGGVRCFVI